MLKNKKKWIAREKRKARAVFMAARVEWKARKESLKVADCYRGLRMPVAQGRPEPHFSMSLIRED